MNVRIPTALAILVSLFVGASGANDPTTQAPRPKPSLGEYPLPPKAKPTPPPKPQSPDEPRDLDINKVRMFWVEDYTSTIPVRWTVTPLDATALVDIFPVGTKPVFIAQGDERAKVHELPDGAKSAIQVWGVAKGRVLIQADGVKDGQIVSLVKVTIDVGGPQSPIPPPDDPKPPIEPPPPVKPLKGHFMAIRPNGPASPEYVRIMSDPAWKELKDAGHSYKDYTLAEASAVVVHIPPGTTLPCVITLDATKRTVLAGPVNLPTDSAGIRKLAEGVK